MISHMLVICLVSILMYADDTTLFCNFDNVYSETKINSELGNII